jgi:hypothetical protein
MIAIWYSSPCGNCKHGIFSHAEWPDFIDEIDTDNLIWVARCKVTNDGPIKLPEQCRCTEWVPKDNLDLVEFLAEKRNLIN